MHFTLTCEEFVSNTNKYKAAWEAKKNRIKEKEMQFNIIIYLKGRREYLKAQTTLYASDTSKAKCAQARLSEICELLTILEGINTKSQAKSE